MNLIISQTKIDIAIRVNNQQNVHQTAITIVFIQYISFRLIVHHLFNSASHSAIKPSHSTLSGQFITRFDTLTEHTECSFTYLLFKFLLILRILLVCSLFTDQAKQFTNNILFLQQNIDLGRAY